MQVASLESQRLGLFSVMGGLSSLKNSMINSALEGQQDTRLSMLQMHAAGDIIDIQQDIRNQLGLMNEFAESVAKEVVPADAEVAEASTEGAVEEPAELSEEQAQLASEISEFEQQVFNLFQGLFDKAQEMFAQGDFSQFYLEVQNTKSTYLEIRASLTIEIYIPAEEPLPQINDLTAQALSTVSQAQISAQDKEQLIELIAMIDEFVKTPAHGHLMRSVIGIVPLMEKTSGSDIDLSFMSADHAVHSYLAQRAMMREETGVERFEPEERNGTYYSFELNFSAQISSRFHIEA